MDATKKRRKSDEQWFKDTERHLGHYRIWEARIDYLNKELERINPKTTPNYSAIGAISGGEHSDQTGDVGTKRAEIETEIKDKEIKIEQVNGGMRLLTEERAAIIRLRFMDELRDWQIYDLSKIPLGKTLYYEERDTAMEILAKYFGYLAC